MTETVPYEITGHEKEIEFRKYPGLVLPTVDSSADDSGFSLLFAYITGSNLTRNGTPDLAGHYIPPDPDDVARCIRCTIDVIRDAPGHTPGGYPGSCWTAGCGSRHCLHGKLPFSVSGDMPNRMT